ncbi:N-6 DNA methylase [candidate division WOR-3 bacterium]|nr:N-6 DNA methylase [candidate division WOR-3 bacterium]
MKDKLKIIKSTFQILNRYCKLYEKISHNRFGNYLDYMKEGTFSDEDDFIKPKLWNDFLSEILEFPKDEILPEFSPTAETPDFIPRETNIHPFIFEIKGTDTKDLSNHYNKLSRYINTCSVRWGVITNMRYLEVYEYPLKSPLQEYSFSFLELYTNYKSHPKVILDYPNTKKFLAFVRHFSHKKLGLTEKIDYIRKARKWTGKEALDSTILTDSIRKIVEILLSDTLSKKEELSLGLRFDPGRKREIENELETIACELDRGRKPKESLLREFTGAKKGSVEYKTFYIYLSRVAYFTMTRILLARMWEDTGFIEESLYNGGFDKWYDQLQREVERVLRQAFHFAGSKYYWLYSVPNNYDWYTPDNEALVDVLYEFSNFNLSKLNTDVLGRVYEEYVDRVDRKNKGQYYTPREIIRLIWDRVGYKDDDSFFVYENGKRKPKIIFDPCTGSGGFLVEAAWRLTENSHYNDRDIDDLIEIMFALVNGLCGSEISLFSHYITEVNLLIQLTPLFKKILPLLPRQTRFPVFTLSVVPCDALGLHNPRAVLVNSKEVKESLGEYGKIMALHDPHKRVVYEKIRNEGKFYYVCSNPPYVGEKGHKELFRSVLSDYPNYWWKNFYQGKMDYLYFFVILGLSKLKEGGKLGFITTSYWPTADGASKLRKYILEHTLIKEIIDFGEVKIFEGAKGQHNMVFILEKCPDRRKAEKTIVEMDIKENIERKKNHRIKIVKVKKDFRGKTYKEKMENMVEWIEKYIDRDEYEDDYIDVFYSGVKQGELTDGVWNLMQVGRIVGLLEKIKQKGEPLIDICNINQGLVSGAPKVNNENIKLLPNDSISRYNIKQDDGIFVLNKQELQSLHLSKSELTLIKPYFRQTQIDPYFAEEENRLFVIYTTKDTDLKKYPRVRAHLEKFRPILENRLKIYEENYPWYKLHRERNPKIFEDEKIVTPNFSPQNSFAWTSKPFYTEFDSYFITGKSSLTVSLKYLTSILNSKIAKFWCVHNTKRKGEKGLIKVYNTTSVSKIPIRRINFNNKKEIEIHNFLMEKVDKIIKLKKELAEYNKFYSGVRLTRIEKLKDAPEPDEYLLTKYLPDENKRNIRTHSKVAYEPQNPTDFYLSDVGNIEPAPLFAKKLDEPLLSILLKGKNKKSMRIIAPREIIDYLGKLLLRYKGKSWDEIKEIPIAKDLKTFISKKKEVSSRVKSFLKKVQKIQTEIDEIVYCLYGITKNEIKIIEKTLS